MKYCQAMNEIFCEAAMKYNKYCPRQPMKYNKNHPRQQMKFRPRQQ